MGTKKRSTESKPQFVPQDAATKLSLNYLQALENRLKIAWNGQGEPICIPRRLPDKSLNQLKSDLDDLLNGELGIKARDASARFGKTRIQTVGFGLVSDFDRFVKLGFLYGERVVLWDVVGARLLSCKEFSPALKGAVCQAACNLLLLKPAIERGAIVILPHPSVWSELARLITDDLKAQGEGSVAAFGLSFALAAVEEGLPLHPFTLLQDYRQPHAPPVSAKHAENYYSPENYLFQQAISNLLRDQRVAYLGGISSAEFQRITAEYPELQQELRKHFLAGTTRGLSEQQAKAAIQHSTNSLLKLIEKRNKDLVKYAGDGSEASATFLFSALTLFNKTTLGAGNVPGLLFELGTLGTRLVTAVRKWASTPEKQLIVQAFGEIKNQEVQQALASSEGALTYSEVETRRTKLGKRTLAAKEKFMSCSWTEESHEYLKSLSPEMARKVLNSLEHEDIFYRVNFRRFQEAYIGDYLVDVWPVDRSAFWNQVAVMFEESMLYYDSSDLEDIICGNDMPLKVWEQFLELLLKVLHEQGLESWQKDTFSRIAQFQTTGALQRMEKRAAFTQWCMKLTSKDQNSVIEFIRRAFGGKIPKWFRTNFGVQKQK